MSKTTKPTAAAPAEPAAQPAELPMPTRGGCYVRLPDGSLAPDPTTEPAPQPAQEQAP